MGGPSPDLGTCPVSLLGCSGALSPVHSLAPQSMVIVKRFDFPHKDVRQATLSLDVRFAGESFRLSLNVILI